MEREPETPRRFEITIIFGCFGYLLLAPGIGLTSFCCGPSGSGTASLCSWFGPYLVITGLLLGASIPLTYYVLQWALERDTTWAKRHATSVLPWILLILICITLIGGFSASVPKESELSETDQNQCHSKATRLLGFLQDSRPSHNDTQTNTTVGIVTLQDALDVEKAAFISAGILALFIFILLILSSYHELVLKILGTTWNRNLTSNLIRRPGQLRNR